MRGIIQKPMLGDECMSDGTSIADRGNVLKALMNEGSGNKVFDLSGNGRYGTFVGSPTWVAGGFGAAIEFGGEGSGDYIDANLLAGGINTLEGTIILQLKRTFAVDTAVSKIAVSFRVDSNNNIAIFFNQADNKWTIKYKAGGTTTEIESAASVIPQNILTQVVLTWSKSADEVKAYVNGIQIETTVNGLGVWAGTLSDSRIGATSAGQEWEGTIEFIPIYNRALSASEIAELSREPFSDLGPRRFLPYAPVAAGGVVVPWHLFFNRAA